jgi:hypothetical protein
MTGHDSTAAHFLAWTPFAVLFNADGDVINVVGPDDGDPYSLLGPGDVWVFDPRDETEGEWTRNDTLSIEASVVAARVVATYRTLPTVASPDGTNLRAALERIATLARVWTSEPPSEFTLRELSCEQLGSIASVVALIDRSASARLLGQHAAAADSEWDEPELCRCRTAATPVAI